MIGLHFVYPFILFFFKFNSSFIFSALPDLHCCPRAFSSCSKQELLLAAVQGLLLAVASLVAGHGLKARELQ